MNIPCKKCGSLIDFSPIHTKSKKIIQSRELILCFKCLEENEKENLIRVSDPKQV